MSAHREVAQAEIARRQAATEPQAAPAAEPFASRTYTPEEGAKELGSQLGLEVTTAAKEEVPAAARGAAATVEKAFGKKVVFVKAGQAGFDAQGKARWGTDGAVLPEDPGTVYVNLNSNRKWQALIGHETTHALKRTNAAVYNELQAAVNSALKDEAFTWAGEAYAERTKDIQNEEIVANVVGDQMHEPRFWLEVFGRTGDVKALANAMFSTLDKIRNKITGQSRLDYNTREFITDTKRVRSAVAKAYAAWQKGAQGKTAQPAAALESKPDFGKFVAGLLRTEKGEIAGSRGMGTRDVWNLVQRMERLAREGKPYKGWYRDSAQEILKAFGGDKRSAEIFAQLIAITSANREVKANFTLAEKALVQYAEGQPIEVGSQQTNDKINDLLYFGIPWDGRKTNNFYRDIMQEIGGPKSRETTQDMHMGQMALGKKKLSDSEYSFLDKVTKFVAERFGVKPSEAQAMVWVPQKARSLVRRYLENGFHRGMSAQGMKRMALAEAGINYGSIARKRWAMLGPEVGGFPKAKEIRAQGRQVTAEVKPSTKLPIGQALTKLSVSRLQEYQKTAFNRVFGGDPGILMRAFGLDRTQYRIMEGAGGYDGMTAPNAIVTLNTDAVTAERVAKAWMYIFRQDAVPFFRADPKLANDENAAQGIKLVFAESLSNTQLRSATARSPSLISAERTASRS